MNCAVDTGCPKGGAELHAAAAIPPVGPLVPAARNKQRPALPALLAVVGPPGAGKTTWIRRHVRDAVVVSLDACRERVSPHGCPCDQAATAAAVRLACELAGAGLRAGGLVVWDATNCTPSDRDTGLGLCAEHDARSVAVVLCPPLEVCLARNAVRDATAHTCGYARRVPAATVAATHAALQADLAGLAARWDTVHLVAAPAAGGGGRR